MRRDFANSSKPGINRYHEMNLQKWPKKTNGLHKTPSSHTSYDSWMDLLCALVLKWNVNFVRFSNSFVNAAYCLACLFVKQLLHFTFVNKFIPMEIVCEFFCTFFVYYIIYGVVFLTRWSCVSATKVSSV